MFAALRLCPPWRALPALAALFLYGCSEASSPIALDRVATAPQAFVGPAVIVNNTEDAGSGSLRQAILDAPDGGMIQFAPSIAGKTIALSSGELRIDKALTIEGPLPLGMTISGEHVTGVFIVQDAGNAVFRNLSIVKGFSTNGAGMIVVGTVTLDHVLVADNLATITGGGIYSVVGARVTLLNSTLSGNVSAGGGGGGMMNGNPFGITIIRNSTIAHNTAMGEDPTVGSGGGGIGGGGAVVMHNSIVANNVDGRTGAAQLEANCTISVQTAIRTGTNLSNDDSCGTGTGMVIANPLLGPLASNGGHAATHALLFGSPAIDAGTSCSEPTDQRYVARPQGASCDIGAFEFNSFRNITVTINPNVAVNPKTGVATVSGTLSCMGPVSTEIAVSMSQEQKITGKFTTIVQGSATIPATCNSPPSSWSVVLTPQTGKFTHTGGGKATGSASVLTAPGGYLPATVTAELKLFQVK